MPEEGVVAAAGRDDEIDLSNSDQRMSLGEGSFVSSQFGYDGRCREFGTARVPHQARLRAQSRNS
jgi:hypothetical protein